MLGPMVYAAAYAPIACDLKCKWVWNAHCGFICQGPGVENLHTQSMLLARRCRHWLIWEGQFNDSRQLSKAKRDSPCAAACTACFGLAPSLFSPPLCISRPLPSRRQYNDSKQLSEAKRDSLFASICSDADVGSVADILSAQLISSSMLSRWA